MLERKRGGGQWQCCCGGPDLVTLQRPCFCTWLMPAAVVHEVMYLTLTHPMQAMQIMIAMQPYLAHAGSSGQRSHGGTRPQLWVTGMVRAHRHCLQAPLMTPPPSPPPSPSTRLLRQALGCLHHRRQHTPLTRRLLSRAPAQHWVKALARPYLRRRHIPELLTRRPLPYYSLLWEGSEA